MKDLEALRLDCIKTSKKGLPFIGASIVVWGLIAIIWMLGLPVKQANLYTFFATGVLMPSAFVIGKISKVNIFDSKNPLSQLAFLFSINQAIYLLIPMYVFNFAPEKMLIIFTMVFGAHLFPFSWVYKSISYKIAACVIPVLALLVGIGYSNIVLAIVMIVIEIIFTFALCIECKKEKC